MKNERQRPPHPDDPVSAEQSAFMRSVETDEQPETHSEERESSLERVVTLCLLLGEQQALTARLGVELKEAAKNQRRTEEVDLPELLTELGLGSLRLSCGDTVTVTEECTTAITKANHSSAMAWLRSNGFGGLVKTNLTVPFPRGDLEAAEEALQVIVENHPDAELKEEVHHSTLKAFVKEQLAEGKAIPMDTFGVRSYKKATYKKGN